MTNEEILYKAIQKARKNRWRIKTKVREMWFNDLERRIDWGEKNEIEEREYYDIIFEHKFAKAFWREKEGEKPIGKFTLAAREMAKQFGYQYHLQMMVVYKNPLKYIEKFI